MRKDLLDDWFENAIDLPQELSYTEKEYLKSLGWSRPELTGNATGEYCRIDKLNGQWHGLREIDRIHSRYKQRYKNGKKHGKQEEIAVGLVVGTCYKVGHYFRGKKHGIFTVEYISENSEDTELVSHEEYAYGVLLKVYL